MANEENFKTITSISSLPTELLSQVLVRVAASSSTNLFRAKLCCKLFFEVSEDKKVYQRVSLDKFEIVAWHEDPKVSMFLKKCRHHKNTETLYRKGVVDYFSGENLESALECLEEAAKSDHDGAAYALGIIFLFGGDESKRKHNSGRCSWPIDEIDEEESACEGCACDEEIAPICDALPQFLV